MLVRLRSMYIYTHAMRVYVYIYAHARTHTHAMRGKREFKNSETKLYVRYVVSESLSTLARPLSHKDGRRVAAAGQTRGIWRCMPG